MQQNPICNNVGLTAIKLMHRNKDNGTGFTLDYMYIFHTYVYSLDPFYVLSINFRDIFVATFLRAVHITLFNGFLITSTATMALPSLSNMSGQVNGTNVLNTMLIYGGCKGR